MDSYTVANYLAKLEKKADKITFDRFGHIVLGAEEISIILACIPGIPQELDLLPDEVLVKMYQSATESEAFKNLTPEDESLKDNDPIIAGVKNMLSGRQFSLPIEHNNKKYSIVMKPSNYDTTNTKDFDEGTLAIFKKGLNSEMFITLISTVREIDSNVMPIINKLSYFNSMSYYEAYGLYKKVINLKNQLMGINWVQALKN